MSSYTITKFFQTGLLAGLTVVETSSVEMPVGLHIQPSAISPSGYVVISCEKVGA